MKYIIDINADLGEGSGLDEKIMPLISSCSIACGGHYGTDETIRNTILLAKKYGVKVGAHPSFPDRDNFGRKVLTMTKKELVDSIYNQLMKFFAICKTESIPVHHVKPHGALYNYAAMNAPTADSVVDAILATKERPKLYTIHNSVLHKKAENLLPIEFEAFIDRQYKKNGRLVSRENEFAVISNEETAWKQFYDIVSKQETKTWDGESISITAGTFCIHGDHKASVTILKHIHKQMIEHKIALA